MAPHLNLGRLLGVAMLVTFVIGLLSNFKLQDDLFNDGGLLVNAAAHPVKIGLICVLGMASSLLSLWVATLLTRAFGKSSGGILYFYVAVLAAGLALSLLEFATLLGFREVSEFYRASPETQRSAIEASSRVLAGLRDGIHFVDKILGGFSVVLLFCFLLGSRLLPVWLCLLGIMGASLQMIAVGRALFGGEVAYVMLAPLSLVFIVTMGWLLVAGFRVPLAFSATRTKE